MNIVIIVTIIIIITVIIDICTRMDYSLLVLCTLGAGLCHIIANYNIVYYIASPSINEFIS